MLGLLQVEFNSVKLFKKTGQVLGEHHFEIPSILDNIGSGLQELLNILALSLVVLRVEILGQQ